MVFASDTMGVQMMQSQVSRGELDCRWRSDCGKVAVVALMDPNQRVIPACKDCVDRYNRYSTFGICG